MFPICGTYLQEASQLDWCFYVAWPFGACCTTWLLDSMLLFQMIPQMNFLSYNLLFVRNSYNKKRTTENKDQSVSEAGKNVTDIYTMYCHFLNRGQLVKYRLLFGLSNFKLKWAVTKRASHLTTSVTNLNVERVTGMMRDTHQFTVWKTIEELNMHRGTPQYILMAWCLLSTQTTFPW